MTNNPYAPPVATVDDVVPQAGLAKGQAPFFAVSIFKLVLLSVLTLGIYELYWFYQNWKLIRDREGSDIWPVPRAIFTVFFCHACFARIRDFETPAAGKSDLASGWLATAWIITTLMHKLPQPWWLISLAAVLFVVPVQARANRINAELSPEHDRNSRFTGWNWAIVVFGGIFLLLVLIGSFAPEP
jgi:hypothetical protein